MSLVSERPEADLQRDRDSYRLAVSSSCWIKSPATDGRHGNLIHPHTHTLFHNCVGYFSSFRDCYKKDDNSLKLGASSFGIIRGRRTILAVREIKTRAKTCSLNARVRE